MARLLRRELSTRLADDHCLAFGRGIEKPATTDVMQHQPRERTGCCPKAARPTNLQLTNNIYIHKRDIAFNLWTIAMHPICEKLADIYRNKANGQYGLAAVTQLQHALQSASMAEQDREPDSLIVAALLHDVGHMIHDLGEEATLNGIDDVHEERAAAWLTRYFGPEVTEPVRLHVPAKRYLCATEENYFSKLAVDSVRSLQLQGGPMSAEEVAQFEHLPHYLDAVRLRRLDDRAKDPTAETPDLDHFLPYLDRILSQSLVV